MTTAVYPLWLERYVGIPYEAGGHSHNGCDCYGLVRLVYWEVERRRILPYEDVYERIANGSDAQRFQRIVEAARSKEWVEIPKEKADRLDVLLFRVNGHPCHVGLALDGRYMLHTLKGHDSALENFRSLAWDRRLYGVYRPASRA